MRYSVSTRQGCLWLLAIAVALGAVVLVASPAGAQVGPEADHLKCYQVLRDGHDVKQHVVELFNQQFDRERCRLSDRAALFCAPTVKETVDGQPAFDDPRGGPFSARDYVCYKVTCRPTVTRSFNVDDQFIQPPRPMAIRSARLLCAPANKLLP